MKTGNIAEEPWDFLVVLDACRYDFFERAWSAHLEGKLEKRLSVGSSTNEWRDKSFPGFYADIIYISANPQICDNSAVYGYTAGKHFGKVYEIWKEHWDKEIGTVRPEMVTKAALRIIGQEKSKRFIVHYLQPHAPYLTLAEDARGYLQGDINMVRKLVGANTSRGDTNLGGRLLKSLSRAFRGTTILPNHPEWMVRKLFGVPPKAPLEAAWRAAGRQRLRKAYADNLDAVLAAVADLVRHCSGRIVITSDHGELLGERRCYGHPTGSDHPVLKEIPWLVVERPADAVCRQKADMVAGAPATQSPADTISKTEQEELSDKLRALGYFD